jgi:hypothetical protein
MSVQRNSASKWAIDFTCKGKRITRAIGGSKREAEAAGGVYGTNAPIVRGRVFEGFP